MALLKTSSTRPFSSSVQNIQITTKEIFGTVICDFLKDLKCFSFSKKDCEAYALQMSKLDFNTGKLDFNTGKMSKFEHKKW